MRFGAKEIGSSSSFSFFSYRYLSGLRYLVNEGLDRRSAKRDIMTAREALVI